MKDQKSPVPTPLPTPTSSPVPSVSQQLSLPSTPELSQTGRLVQVPPAPAVLPTAEATESISDDDFPSYNGQSTASEVLML